MPTPGAALRLVAIVMVVVVIGTIAAPAPAHADVLAAIGIATLVVAGVMIVAYLIVANASEKRMSEALPPAPPSAPLVLVAAVAPAVDEP